MVISFIYIFISTFPLSMNNTPTTSLDPVTDRLAVGHVSEIHINMAVHHEIKYLNFNV